MAKRDGGRSEAGRAEPGEVISAFQRTFRVVPVALAEANAVPVAVHVESKTDDKEQLELGANPLAGSAAP